MTSDIILSLQGISKYYEVGKERVSALHNVSLNFRKQEFVAILGPSGSGKTTLLNILGGLDQASEGQLFIHGVSTRTFKGRDWDFYRNRSIGFVFQNYHLIEHQNVRSNVELAQKIKGTSKDLRRKYTEEALGKVGLSDQLPKKPSQMSGGQSQRAAIARALVTKPDIILADEPTGALDSENGENVMELLKEISAERLVIMVTHNAELAKTYATRIITLKDGEVQSDTDPLTVDTHVPEPYQGKAGMNFFTSLRLSLDNLLTKKGRTILTAFAGSIGIIGIALILALSQGADQYLDQLQKDTLANYPIEISAGGDPFATLVKRMDQPTSEASKDGARPNEQLARFSKEKLAISKSQNDITSFTKKLEQDKPDFISALQKDYGLELYVLSQDEDQVIVEANVQQIIDHVQELTDAGMPLLGPLLAINLFSELMPSTDGLVNEQFQARNELMAGHYPQNPREIVLRLDETGSIPDVVLYALGLRSQKDLNELYKNLENQEEITATNELISYDSFLGKKLKVVLSQARFLKEGDIFKDLSITDRSLLMNSEDTIELTISGVIRSLDEGIPVESYVGYTKALTDEIISKDTKSQVAVAQKKSKDIDVLSGNLFAPEIAPDEPAKRSLVSEKIESQTEQERASTYRTLMTTMDPDDLSAKLDETLSGLSKKDQQDLVINSLKGLGFPEDSAENLISSMDDDTFRQNVEQIITRSLQESYAKTVMPSLLSLSQSQMAEKLIVLNLTKEQVDLLYDSIVAPDYSERTYADNLRLFGSVTDEELESIRIYAKTFEDKEKISNFITAYNDTVEEDQKISYTDLVALLMSSVTKVIRGVSYLLIAFVAISLIVSSIMIGIITSISVMERTKEIGILRALGASRTNVAQVFTAETLIVGLIAGILGNLIASLLLVPINSFIQKASGIPELKAVLSPQAMIILTLISVVLTVIAGLYPSSKAAKADPVKALRGL